MFAGRASIYPHEAAAALRVTRQHIVNLIQRGELKAKQIGPSKTDCRILIGDWETFLYSRWQREGDFLDGSRCSWRRNVQNIRSRLSPKDAKTVGHFRLSRKALELLGQRLFPGDVKAFYLLLKESGVDLGECP